MSKAKMAKLSVGGTTFVLPLDVAMKAFELLDGVDVLMYVQISGTYTNCIVPGGDPAVGYSGKVALESIGDFETISLKALGETYMKEKAEK